MADDIPLAEALGHVLKDTFSLYVAAHLAHWNVRGPRFPSLHKLFGDQYAEVWGAVDVIAEQIRTLGELAPTDLTSGDIAAPGANADEETMIATILAGHETVISALDVAFKIAEAADDEGTMNLLADRMNAHKKHAWFLRATLGEV